ncbi:FAD-dependent oxidoreductase [Niallia taxi]|uniref:NAD(P)/FAD-dependent oxidoreductase n=1 Tax=Niallia taxi TaxID=2499688 RepID=UPI002E1A9AE2|nr:FAD-dependent oxidoreductase [Niallia taxi]MED4118166.1 FAD-dependent oxidoreductase [Niallia taxi]
MEPNLYHGNLYWPNTLQYIPSYPSLAEDIVCDVLIVGGGMSGAISAYILSHEDLNIVVADKRKIAHGSSSANTGLLQYSNDMMLHEFAQSIGEEEAVRFYRLCFEAMEDLKGIAGSLKEDVQFKSRKSLYYASTQQDAAKLQTEYNMLKKHGFPVEYLHERDIKERFGFSKPAAILTDGDAEVNPQKFVMQLMKEAASQENVQVFEQTEMKELGFSDGYWHFTSDKGATIRAKKVIYSTGYEAALHTNKLGAELNRSFVIATTPIESYPGWEDMSLIWETKRPYFYMRTTYDGRIVAGGLDEDPMEAPSDPAIIQKYGEKLLARIKEHYPDYEIEVDYAYGATFGESVDGRPFIGRHPSKEDIFYCLGYGGNGTVYSMFGAKMIREIIIHGQHPDENLVAPDRPIKESASN